VVLELLGKVILFVLSWLKINNAISIAFHKGNVEHHLLISNSCALLKLFDLTEDDIWHRDILSYIVFSSVRTNGVTVWAYRFQ